MTHDGKSTNELLAEAAKAVETLIGWAEGDVEHSREAGAAWQARDDQQRAKRLKKALELLNTCGR